METTGLNDVPDVAAEAGRDQQSAGFVVRSVQRDCEVPLPAMKGELFDSRGPSARGDGDAAGGECHSFRVADSLQSGDQIVEIQQGFADSHDDHVVGQGMDFPAGAEKLFDDLSGVQIADKSSGPAGAERTPDRTADLSAQTECHPSVSGGNQGAFDEFAVAEFEQKFSGSVGGEVFRNDLYGIAEKMFRELFSCTLGKIGHRVGIDRPAFGHPPFDLTGPVGFDSTFLCESGKLVDGCHDEIRTFFFSCHHSVSCLSSPFQRFRRSCRYSRLKRFFHARSGTIGTSGAST